jgi:alpha-tubulin suppressor-like RCC1 family protein
VRSSVTTLCVALGSLLVVGCGRIGFGTMQSEVCNGRDDDGDGVIDEGIDVEVDPDNCGACGNKCELANAIPACVDGLCEIGECAAGYGDCNGTIADGCEIGLSSDDANCGVCARVCSSGGCYEGTCDTDVVELAAGGEFTCGRMAAGDVYCWGESALGQLGDGTTTDRERAAPALVTGVKHVALGFAHACATHGAGASCWGDNAAGQLGDGTTIGSSTPVRVALPETGEPYAIAAGRAHSCAALESGAVACWGENGAGQLGDGTTTDRPTPVLSSGLAGVVQVSAGDSHTCAMTDNGEVFCWGDNQWGQLGNGTTDDALTPTTTDHTGQAHIEVGSFHTCSHGSAWCWGRNDEGQLGNGSLEMKTTPTPVEVPSHANVTAGEAHSCILTEEATVYCTGRNTSGQLGDGTTTSTAVAVEALGVAGARHVSAGALHTCAAIPGAVLCWGSNGGGQLGDDTRTDRATPVGVVGLP